MKNRIFSFLVLLPCLVFGQVTEEKLTENLPEDLKYELITSDFYKNTFNKRRKKWNGKEMIGDSMKLGCSSFEDKGIPIAFMFSMYKKNKREEYPFRLYAYKRRDYESDEEIINALDVYCYYGQSNYYFMSNDYILFTYSLAGDFPAREDQKRMTKIENQLVKNLNNL